MQTKGDGYWRALRRGSESFVNCLRLSIVWDFGRKNGSEDDALFSACHISCMSSVACTFVLRISPAHSFSAYVLRRCHIHTGREGGSVPDVSEHHEVDERRRSTLRNLRGEPELTSEALVIGGSAYPPNCRRGAFSTAIASMMFVLCLSSCPCHGLGGVEEASFLSMHHSVEEGTTISLIFLPASFFF